MKSYTIHLLRHGAAEEIKQGAYIGTKDVPLSELGVRELKYLTASCVYPQAPVLFTSPLKRCLSTCELVYPHLKPIVIDDLRECSFGEWEGLTADDLKNNNDFKSWLAGEEGAAPPKGESGAEFTRRVCAAFESIVNGLIKTGNTESIMVTHGGVIMTILAVYGLPQAKPFDWAMEDGCGYSVRVTPSLWSRDKVMEVYAQAPYDKEVSSEQ